MPTTRVVRVVQCRSAAGDFRSVSSALTLRALLPFGWDGTGMTDGHTQSDLETSPSLVVAGRFIFKLL